LLVEWREVIYIPLYTGVWYIFIYPYPKLTRQYRFQELARYTLEHHDVARSISEHLHETHTEGSEARMDGREEGRLLPRVECFKHIL
jgi:hypothetical protein